MINSPNVQRVASLLLSICMLVLLAACSEDDKSTSTENAAKEKRVAYKKQSAETAVVQTPPVDFKRKPLNSDVGSTMTEGFEKSYVLAMWAVRKRNYDLAYSELTRALSFNNQEQLELILPGRKPGSYLPHFYLGEIAYQNGDCVAAMNHWNVSLSQGVIQQTSKYPDLNKSMAECEGGY